MNDYLSKEEMKVAILNEKLKIYERLVHKLNGYKNQFLTPEELEHLQQYGIVAQYDYILNKANEKKGIRSRIKDIFIRG